MLPTSLTEWNVIYKNTRLARVSNNNVIIQSTAIASLPATLFPGFISAPVARWQGVDNM